MKQLQEIIQSQEPRTAELMEQEPPSSIMNQIRMSPSPVPLQKQQPRLESKKMKLPPFSWAVVVHSQEIKSEINPLKRKSCAQEIIEEPQNKRNKMEIANLIC